jgi:hypothetical protein
LVGVSLEKELEDNHREKVYKDLGRKFGVFFVIQVPVTGRIQGCIKLEMKINLGQLIFIKIIVVYLYSLKPNKMIVEKQTKSMVEIDLTGEQGNVFNLIGTGMKYCRQLGLNQKDFFNEMTKGDYENSVKVFDEHFGHFVKLLR